MPYRLMLICGFILIVFPGLFAQEEELRLEGLMPADTALLFKCSGIDTLLEEGKSLDLIRLWNDPELKDFFADALEAVVDELPDADDPPLPMDEVWNLCRGEVALAWTGGLTMGPVGPMPSVALALDMGGQKEAILEACTGFVEMVAWAQNLDRSEEEFKGVKILSVGREGGINIHTCALENLFLATLKLEDLHAMVETRIDGKPSLAANPVFVQAKDRAAGQGVDMMTFIQLPTLIRNLQPMMPIDMHGALDKLGLASVEALCMATTLEGGVSRDSLYLHSPGEKKGLLKAFSPQPLSDAALSQAPPDALWFVGAAVDFKELKNSLESFIPMVNPQYLTMVQGGLEEIKTMTGLDVENELLSALGKEFTFSLIMPKMGGMIPDVVMSVAIENEEVFNPVFEKLVAAISGMGEIGTSTYDERTLRHVKLPPQIPLSPTFTVRDGRLLITTTTLAMKKHLKWLAKGEPGLGEAEDYNECMAGVPAGASVKGFMNVRRGVEIGYGVAGPFLPAVLAQSDVPFDPAMMPMTETLVDYLSNASFFVVSDEQGLLLSQRSSVGFGTCLAIMTSAVDYFMKNDLLAAVIEQQRNVPVFNTQVAPQQHPELGEIYSSMRRGANEYAEGRLTAYMERNPGQNLYTIWALRNRAECRMKLERFEDAAADFERLAEQDPVSRGYAYYSIARIHTKGDAADKAVPYVIKAIAAGHRIFDNDPDLDKLRGNPQYDVFIDMVMDTSGLMADSEYEDAAGTFTNWLFNNPYHALAGWALKNRGDCYLWLESYDEAVVDYEKAAEMDITFGPSAYYNIACICSTNEEPERAVEFLKKAMDTGFCDYDLMDNDGDLDDIREDPRFKALRWRF